MSDLFTNYEPKKVLNYFFEISQIPRGSGQEEAISNYLYQFAKQRNLEVSQDNYKNILIKKPATKGLENAQTVILQGHMDMVWEKNKDNTFDFKTEGIKLRIVDDYVYAYNTTLGADNGIALAMILSILDSDDVPHPALEAVLTVEEETGLAGAMNFDTNQLEGTIFLNLDSEDDCEILTSCAGGVRIYHKIPYKPIKKPGEFAYYKISIKGLKGGHSGMEINKERGNANKLLGRVLNSIRKEMKLHIVEISGGSKDNAIPREAEANVLVDNTELENLSLIIRQAQRNLSREYANSDPNLKVDLSFIEESPQECMDKSTTDKIIQLLMMLPTGVQSMSTDIEGLVDSSLNMGVMKCENNTFILLTSARSTLTSEKDYIVNYSMIMAEVLGIECITDSEYPGWAYEKESPLREKAVEVYKKLYGEEPKVVAVHAGVECGIFKEKKPDLDMISFGPSIYDVHTPDEHISIPSIKKSWEFLLELLKTR